MAFSAVVFGMTDLVFLTFGSLLLYGSLCVLAAYLYLSARNRRLEIDGDRLCSYSATGRATSFQADDLAGVSIAALNGYSKLYGRDGRVLFKFQASMRNYPLLMQYLAEHHVPLRG